MRHLLRMDRRLAAWWGSPVECRSALARLRRDGIFDSETERQARQPLREPQRVWTELLPSSELRAHAIRLLSVHSLRAVDSLQLAAAITAANLEPTGYRFVCLDDRLRSAAEKEGFDVLPQATDR